jgi:PAS domain S-box-containing protein
LLLLEAARSDYAERIERAAQEAGLRVQHLDSVANVPPEATLVGVGPSIHDPLNIARDLRRTGAQPLLLFFAASASARQALQAELVRDPFLYPRFELIEVPESPRQLAQRLGRVVARIERLKHTAATTHRRRPRRQITLRAQPAATAEHFLSSVVGQTTDAVVSADRDLRILTWNRAAETLFGIPASDALGKPLTVLAGVYEAAQKVRETQQAQDVHVVLGETKLSVSIAPVTDARGTLLGLSIVGRDDSEFERIQTALQDANRQKDEFLAIMSHELRTPLTSILGYTDMLLRGLSGELAPMAHKYVGNVRSAGDRLLDLVNGLLDFTRLEAGVERLEMHPVELSGLVHEQVRRSQSLAKSKEIELRFVMEDAIGRVQADAEKLSHVVRSFVGNALKFTNGPGLVEVRVTPDPDSESHVRVSVVDSGIGMRQDQLPRVWERFYQGDASLTRAYGGMGLGLSIARHLVTLHGGTVGAESRGPGLGSTFWFSLPRARVG